MVSLDPEGKLNKRACPLMQKLNPLRFQWGFLVNLWGSNRIKLKMAAYRRINTKERIHTGSIKTVVIWKAQTMDSTTTTKSWCKLEFGKHKTDFWCALD